ncbi:AAA family ATPase [Escherichia coli]
MLLVGPPGTGKTLLAKAIAGEAEGAVLHHLRFRFRGDVRWCRCLQVSDMFEQAKKSSPCIIFIDEIDAVSHQRGAGLGGGHDEREQTLNQMLVEMDGFEGNEGIIVIAATNRPDVLDPALLRPGRFDRRWWSVCRMSVVAEQILKVHMRKVPLADDVNPALIAQWDTRFLRCGLANLVNEAALFSARESRRVVSMAEFEKAKDKMIVGAEHAPW